MRLSALCQSFFRCSRSQGEDLDPIGEGLSPLPLPAYSWSEGGLVTMDNFREVLPALPPFERDLTIRLSDMDVFTSWLVPPTPLSPPAPVRLELRAVLHGVALEIGSQHVREALFKKKVVGSLADLRRFDERFYGKEVPSSQDLSRLAAEISTVYREFDIFLLRSIGSKYAMNSFVSAFSSEVLKVPSLQDDTFFETSRNWNVFTRRNPRLRLTGPGLINLLLDSWKRLMHSSHLAGVVRPDLPSPSREADTEEEAEEAEGRDIRSLSVLPSTEGDVTSVSLVTTSSSSGPSVVDPSIIHLEGPSYGGIPLHGRRRSFEGAFSSLAVSFDKMRRFEVLGSSLQPVLDSSSLLFQVLGGGKELLTLDFCSRGVRAFSASARFFAEPRPLSSYLLLSRISSFCVELFEDEGEEEQREADTEFVFSSLWLAVAIGSSEFDEVLDATLLGFFPLFFGVPLDALRNQFLNLSFAWVRAQGHFPRMLDSFEEKVDSFLERAPEVLPDIEGSLRVELLEVRDSRRRQREEAEEEGGLSDASTDCSTPRD